MGAISDFIIVPHLSLDPGLNDVLAEDSSIEQILMIFFQGIQGLFQGGGQRPYFTLDFLAGLLDVHIKRSKTCLHGVDLLADAVDARHEDSTHG